MNIVLFDGDCHICHRSVQFIIKRDPAAHIYFASLQSHVGLQIQSQYQIPENMNSLLFVTNGRVYRYSSAVLHICEYLTGMWKLLYLLIIIPRPIRDWFYKCIANNRYRWFGKYTECKIPTPEERRRFL